MRYSKKITFLKLQQLSNVQISQQQIYDGTMVEQSILPSLHYVTDSKQLSRSQLEFNEEEVIYGIQRKKAVLNKNKNIQCIFEKEKKYDEYLIPPDWQAAERHALANRVGRNKIPKEINKVETYQVCQCCDHQIEKEDLSLREQVNQLSFLGSGYPLFFHYMKYCIIILGLIILTSGEYNLLSNYQGGSCMTNVEKKELERQGMHVSGKQCIADIISIWSIANKNKKVDYAQMQDVLNFTTILVLMILIFFFRKEQMEIDAQCDIEELTPADFTIMVKRLLQMFQGDLILQIRNKRIQYKKLIPFEFLFNQYKQYELNDPKLLLLILLCKTLKSNIQHKIKIKILSEYSINIQINQKNKQIKDLPQDTKLKDIKDFFQQDEKQFGKIEIKKINLVYDLAESHEIQEKIQSQIDNKKQALQDLHYGEEFRKKVEEYDLIIEEEQKALEKKHQEMQKKQSHFTGYAFVSFNTEQQKQNVLKQAQNQMCEEIFRAIFFQSTDFKALKFKDTQIEIREAPEPLDIIWENLNMNEDTKKKRRLISFFITVILFIVCTIIIFFLIKFQADSVKQNQQRHKDDVQKKDMETSEELKQLFVEQLPSAIVSLCMVCLNSVMIEIIFRKIVKMESYNTHTMYNINLAQKLSLALFVNTALIIAFMSIFYTKNVFGKGGLIYTIFYFFVVNAGSSFMSLIFDPMLYFKRAQVWYYKRQGDKCKLTQKEANQLCEYPLHEIEIGYVDIMKTMYITIFYSPVVPVGLFISLLGFCLYYWAQKVIFSFNEFIILKERTIDKQIGKSLSIEMTEYLEFIIQIYTASNLIFEYQIIGQVSYLQIAGFSIGLIYSLMPMQLIVEKIFFFGNDDETFDYDSASSYFMTTYEMVNPITSIQAKKDHKKKTKSQVFKMDY